MILRTTIPLYETNPNTAVTTTATTATAATTAACTGMATQLMLNYISSRI